MDEIEIPAECWLLIMDQIDYYQTMINLSRVSKLFYFLIPDKLWIIKENKCSYLLGTRIPHGKHKLYKDGRKAIVKRYINGKLEGMSKCWYPNGNVRWEVMYKQNKEMGPIREWNEDGIISHHYYCKLGIKSGPFKSWYDKGCQKVDCCFVDGKIIGNYRCWHRNGKLRINCHYLNGKLEDEYQKWHSNGQLEISCYFKQGKVIGDYREYSQEGKLIIIRKLLTPMEPWSNLSARLLNMFIE